MKLFIKYTSTVVLIVAVISTSLFYLINSGLRKQKTDYFGKLNVMIYGQEKFDIVFLGSSRVNWTIDPAIIDSVTKKNSFNFGLDGAYIVEDGMHIRLYLKSHPKPDILVVNIDPKMFNVGDEIKTPARYLPYVKHPEIYDTLKKYSNWPVVVKYMPFVGMSFYTDGIVNQALQAYVQPNRKMENYYKGFSPLKKIWEKTADSSAQGLLTFTYTDKGFDLFRKFLAEIRSKKINLQLIYSPHFYMPEYDAGFRKFMDKVSDIAGEFGYSVIDYTKLDICSDKKYFFDATHLNITGAFIFSQKLGADLDSIMLEKPHR